MKYGKYSKKLARELCELLATGKYSIADSCKKVGVSRESYYVWIRNKPDFAEAVKETEAKRLESYKEMAVSGLAKLLDVHEYDEVTTEYENDKEGNPKIRAMKRVKKKIMPNPAAVIFTLANRDPENWKNRQDITSKGEKIEAATPFMQIIMEASKKDDGE